MHKQSIIVDKSICRIVKKILIMFPLGLGIQVEDIYDGEDKEETNIKVLYQIVTSLDNINCESGFTFNFVILHYKLGSI